MKKLIALVAALAVSVFAHAAAPHVADISKAELEAAIATKSAVILDVNGSDSYKEGHIPGAIDFFAHRDELARLLPANKDALIVAYCGSERCRAYQMGADAALALGYTNVKHFAPGIMGWKKSGAPTEKG
jgi:rhodanese-related sulfurtransferase